MTDTPDDAGHDTDLAPEADKTLPEKVIETAIEADPDAGFAPAQVKQNWVKMAIDFGAPLAFGATYFIAGRFKLADHDMPLLLATGVLVAVSAVALLAGLVLEKRVAWMPLIVGVFGIIFGGLTLYFHDTTFIKIKLTFMNAAFGLALLGGLVLKKQPLKALLGEALPLKEAAWPKLTLYYGLFFCAVAVANEIIWRTQAEAVWVTFKSSMFLVTIAFSLLLTPFLMKNLVLAEAPKASGSPSA